MRASPPERFAFFDFEMSLQPHLITVIALALSATACSEPIADADGVSELSREPTCKECEIDILPVIELGAPSDPTSMREDAAGRGCMVGMLNDGRVVVSGGVGGGQLLVYDAEGRLQTVWGQAGQGPGEFGNQIRIWVGPNDTLYVVDDGNARVRAASTVRFEEEVRSEFDSHDFGPDFHDLTPQRRHHVLNLAQQIGSSEFLTHIANNNYHARSVFREGQLRMIDYAPGTYQVLGPSSFSAQYGPVVRSSDVLLATSLVASREDAELVGTSFWLGREHQVVEMPFPGSPPLTLYVRRDTGAVTKMTRVVGDMLVSYAFTHHETQNGFLIAREASLYGGRQQLFFSFGRRIAVNDPRDLTAFDIEQDLVEEPVRTDQSLMTVEAVGTESRVTQVGQDDAYTAFINTGDTLIAFGVSASFASRLAAYRSVTGSTHPLRYAIVTDHHRAETEGASEALSAGATLLATSDAASRLRETLSEPPSAGKIQPVEAHLRIGGADVLSLRTAHASHVLVVVDAAEGLLLQSNHYASPYRDQGFYAKYSATTLLGALQRVRPGIGLTSVISTESRKPEAWQDFLRAVEAHDATPCYRERNICS